MVKITLVDDHHLVRDGIKSLIETHNNYKVINEYDSAEKFLSGLDTSSGELLITDISLPGISGIDLTKELRKRSANLKIIVLSMYDEQWHIKGAFDAGADGYLLKDCNKEELFTAIENVCTGKQYISNSAMKALSNSVLNEKGNDQIPFLSEREKEVIKLMAEGINSEEIAQQLCLSPKTISNHRANIMLKLDAKNSSELIAKAIKSKII